MQPYHSHCLQPILRLTIPQNTSDLQEGVDHESNDLTSIFALILLTRIITALVTENIYALQTKKYNDSNTLSRNPVLKVDNIISPHFTDATK